MYSWVLSLSRVEPSAYCGFPAVAGRALAESVRDTALCDSITALSCGFPMIFCEIPVVSGGDSAVYVRIPVVSGGFPLMYRGAQKVCDRAPAVLFINFHSFSLFIVFFPI